MSVTFTAADLADEGLPTLEPCLCTQMHESFGDWVRHGAGDPETMKAAASSDCWTCKGSGIEAMVLSTVPQLNFANLNAAALIRAMGIEQDYYHGEMTVAQARRGILRARNTKFQMATQPDWKQVFGGARIIGGELTRESVLDHVNRFAAFVDTVAKLGAKRIRWY